MESRIARSGVYLRLFIASLRSVASASYLTVELDRDVREIERRFQNEGLSFLTKTIPSLAKAIDMALATAAPLRCRGFELKRGTQIPLFLGCLIERVFDRLGNERENACVDTLRSLRQVCYLLYKLDVPSTEKQNNEVITKFKRTDSELPPIGGVPYKDRYMRPRRYEPLGKLALDAVGLSYDSPPRTDIESVFRMGRVTGILAHARAIICRVVGEYDPVDERIFAPRHGPGAVADGERGAEKSDSFRYFSDLHDHFHYWKWFVYNDSHTSDIWHRVLSREKVRKAGTAKVVLVPKDSRGPRLISAEPKEYQWIQQGLRRVIEYAIENHDLTSGRINFRDQEVNRRLALLGSAGEPWVTLDMKDASDRVSCALVSALFPERWTSHLMAARTTATRLPTGEVFRMRKFAPMGSSVCFPVESLVFFALAVAAITIENGPSMTAAQAAERVYVFGDDLVVRLEDHQHVLRHLPSFYLMFNEAKCCVAGSFRESCGCDAFKGVDVTPLRLKSTWDPRSSTSIASYVEFHNSACERGLYQLADLTAELLRTAIRLPYTERIGQSFLSLVDHRKTADQVRIHNRRFRRRYNLRYQRWEVNAWSVCSRSERAATSGWGEMLRVASLSPPSLTEADGHSAPGMCVSEKMRMTPSNMNFHKFIPREIPVRAYWYTLPRRVTLKRGWHQVET